MLKKQHKEDQNFEVKTELLLLTIEFGKLWY